MLRKTQLMFGLSCVLLPGPLFAQDSAFLLSDPIAADNEWHSSYDGTWDPGWDRSWSRSAAPWTLSILAGSRLQSSLKGTSDQSGNPTQGQHRDYYAMATLQVPLEQLPLTSGRQAKLETQPSSNDLAGDTTVAKQSASSPSHQLVGSISASGQENQELLSDDVPAVPRMKQATTGSSDLAYRQASHKRLVVRQAAQLMRLLLLKVNDSAIEQSQIAEIRSLRRRSRLSGLVPELRLRGVYGFDQSISQEANGGLYAGDSTTRGGRDSLLEARLTFRLDRLVYGDGESTMFQKRRDLIVEQRKREQTIVELLVDWMAAKRKSTEPDLLPEELLKILQEEELALLTLNQLTDGWFTGESTLIDLGFHRLLADLSGSTPAAIEQAPAPVQEESDSSP